MKKLNFVSNSEIFIENLNHLQTLKEKSIKERITDFWDYGVVKLPKVNNFSQEFEFVDSSTPNITQFNIGQFPDNDTTSIRGLAYDINGERIIIQKNTIYNPQTKHGNINIPVPKPSLEEFKEYFIYISYWLKIKEDGQKVIDEFGQLHNIEFEDSYQIHVVEEFSLPTPDSIFLGKVTVFRDGTLVFDYSNRKYFKPKFDSLIYKIDINQKSYQYLHNSEVSLKDHLNAIGDPNFVSPDNPHGLTKEILGIPEPLYYPFFNLLDNGNFEIWQRGDYFNFANSIYTADRWKLFLDSNVSGSVTKEFSTWGIKEGLYSLKIVSNGNGTGYGYITQIIDKPFLLRDKKISGSVYCKCNKAYKVFIKVVYDNNIFVSLPNSLENEWEILKFENLVLPSTLNYLAIGISFPLNEPLIIYLDGFFVVEGPKAIEYRVFNEILDEIRCLGYFEKGKIMGCLSVFPSPNQQMFYVTVPFKVKKRGYPLINFSYNPHPLIEKILTYEINEDYVIFEITIKPTSGNQVVIYTIYYSVFYDL